MDQVLYAIDLFGLNDIFATGKRPEADSDTRRWFNQTSGVFVNWSDQSVIVSAAHVYANPEFILPSPMLTEIAKYLEDTGMTPQQVARNLLTAVLDPTVQIEYGFHAHSPVDLTSGIPLVPEHSGELQLQRYTEANVLASLVGPKLFLAGEYQLTDDILHCFKWLNDTERNFGAVIEDNHWIVEIALSSLWNDKLRKTLPGLLGPHMPFLGPDTQRVEVLRLLGMVLGVTENSVRHKLWYHNEGRTTESAWFGASVTNEASAMNRAAVYDWPNDMNLLLTQRGDDSEDFAVLPQTSLHQIQHYGLLDCRDLELARFGVTFNGEKLCILVVTNRGPVQVFVEKAHFSGSGLVPIFARCEYCDEVYPYDIIEHKFIGLGGVGDGCCPDCGLDLDVDM